MWFELKSSLTCATTAVQKYSLHLSHRKFLIYNFLLIPSPVKLPIYHRVLYFIGPSMTLLIFLSNTLFLVRYQFDLRI